MLSGEISPNAQKMATAISSIMSSYLRMDGWIKCPEFYILFGMFDPYRSKSCISGTSSAMRNDNFGLIQSSAQLRTFTLCCALCTYHKRRNANATTCCCRETICCTVHCRCNRRKSAQRRLYGRQRVSCQLVHRSSGRTGTAERLWRLRKMEEGGLTHSAGSVAV